MRGPVNIQIQFQFPINLVLHSCDARIFGKHVPPVYGPSLAIRSRHSSFVSEILLFFFSSSTLLFINFSSHLYSRPIEHFIIPSVILRMSGAVNVAGIYIRKNKLFHSK